MKILKTLILGLLFFGVFGNIVEAQTNTLNEFSITVSRTNFENARIFLRGSNFEIDGDYIQTYAPRACQPCSQNQSPNFTGILDMSSVYGARGYVNGNYYSQLYVAYQLDYFGQQNIRIPRSWSKTVRVSSTITLTGRIGIWERAQDVGNLSNALFHQANVNLMGRASLSLYWYLNANGSGRLYEDKNLTYTFSQTSAAQK